MARRSKAKRRRTAPEPVQQAVDARLGTLIVDLLVAGTQVLVEEFAFSEDQARAWFQQTLARVERSRHPAPPDRDP